MRFAILVLILCTSMLGQPTPKALAPPIYGTVSGRILCVDTNGPARFASVGLQTINVKPEPTKQPETTPIDKMIKLYQTGLDGSFAIPKVSPGTYYLVIQNPGYISPIKQFTQTELQQPTPEILARILKVVPTITVEANQTATIETRIERGAELSGTIRYDDGAPAGATYVSVLQRESKNGKNEWISKSVGTSTDDLGRFRIAGLPAGEYLLQVGLSLNDSYVSSLLESGGNMMMNTHYNVGFFSGDVPRKDKGKAIKLAAGEQRDGTDITIPVSKLHSVSGTLTEQRSGHVINAGEIALNFSDGTELIKTKIGGDDSSFHFDFVPEGEYVLAVVEAKDVVREPEAPKPNTFTMPGQMKETTVRTYGTATQPLIVQNDVTGLTVAVPASPAKPAGTQ